MNLPALPDNVGNPALDGFAPLTAPPGISLLPQTAAWFWLGVVIGGLLLLYVVRRLRQYWINRYRRQALLILAQLPGDAPDYCARINGLLKAATLTAYPQHVVAPLWGKQWGQFLNKQCAEPPFSQTSVHLLGTVSYHPQVIDAGKAAALRAEASLWLRHHQRGKCDV